MGTNGALCMLLFLLWPTTSLDRLPMQDPKEPLLFDWL